MGIGKSSMDHHIAAPDFTTNHHGSQYAPIYILQSVGNGMVFYVIGGTPDTVALI